MVTATRTSVGRHPLVRRHGGLRRLGVDSHLEVELVGLGDTEHAPACTWCAVRRAQLHVAVELVADDETADLDDQLGEQELDLCWPCVQSATPFLRAATARAATPGVHAAEGLADATAGLLVRLGLGQLAESTRVTASGAASPVTSVHI